MNGKTNTSAQQDLIAAQLQLTELEQQLDQQNRLIQYLEANERRLRLAVDGTGLGLWDWHIPSGSLFCNSTWSEMLGYYPGELPPNATTFRNLLHPDDVEPVDDALAAHLRGEIPFFHLEVRLKHRAGHWVWVLDQGRVVEWSADGKPLRMIGTHRDITEHKQVELEIRRQAVRDPLTQLLNRRGLEQQFQRVMAHAQEFGAPFGIGYIDVNEFKSINDCYGHAAGDAVLQEVALRLISVVRADDLVARYGGDEFVLLLPHINRTEDLERVAQRVAAVAEVPILSDRVPLQVSLSLGMVLWPQDGADLTQLLAQADRAMYQQKYGERGVAPHCPASDRA